MEEAKLVVEEKFSNRSERGSLKELTAEGAVEDLLSYVLFPCSLENIVTP